MWCSKPRCSCPPRTSDKHKEKAFCVGGWMTVGHPQSTEKHTASPIVVRFPVLQDHVSPIARTIKTNDSRVRLHMPWPIEWRGM
jgi:hypothetical protein